MIQITTTRKSDGGLISNEIIPRGSTNGKVPAAVVALLLRPDNKAVVLDKDTTRIRYENTTDTRIG
jgi:hypothetical protein